MTQKNLPQLSEATVGTLLKLKKQSKDDLHLYVKALLIEGWSLRAIAEPLEVSRTTVMNWKEKAPKAALPEVQPLPVVQPKDRTSRSKKKPIATEVAEELKALTESASTIRRFTDEDAQSRKDAIKLESLLLRLTDAGHTHGQLATACGVSRSSIAQRLRKYK